MRPPRLRGEMERRLLVNYRLDPDVAAAALPDPFRPQLRNGYAVAGICLIRLGSMRPAGWPGVLGLRSENAAHRFAVEWALPGGGVGTGVYIPRRDCDSAVNVALGGRVFPGEHHRASFDVRESADTISIVVRAHDATGRVEVDAVVGDAPGGSAVFADLAEASRFFETGSLGWSATGDRSTFDGLRLVTAAWQVEPARVTRVRSSFFDDPSRFPPGSTVLDSALLMRRVPVDWLAVPRLRAPASAGGG